MSSGGSTEGLPDRVQWEVDRFDEADVEVETIREDGLWTLRFQRPFQGELLDFKVVFPHDYPDIEPNLYGPPGVLPRHQNPETGSLCLVDNEVNWWRTWLSAMDLVKQLDTLLRATEEGRESVVAQEAPMAEPLTGYLSYRDDITILVPESLLGDDLGASDGTFRLLRINEHLHVVAELHDATQHTVAKAEDAVLRLTRDQGAVGGWVELDKAPAVADLIPALKEASKRALEKRNTWKSKSKSGRRARPQKHTRTTGLTFFEEGPGQGEHRRTWVFAETEPRPNGDVVWVRDRPIRAQAVSQPQRLQRTPELDGLQQVRILMVGAGSLGSGVAVELAKGGAGLLDIFDPDVYEPGNSVRHVLPVSAAGRNKAEALAELCRALNPFCNANGHAATVGHSAGDPDWVLDAIGEADLLIETTGSHAVTRLLCRRAQPLGINVVTAALSRGGFGGRVLVLRASGPCWDCFLRAQDRGVIPIPEEGPRHDQTPFGCSHPAASCAGFDVTHVAAVASRMAVQSLRRTRYPQPDHDWTVLNFRPGKTPVQQGALHADPDCPIAHG